MGFRENQQWISKPEYQIIPLKSVSYKHTSQFWMQILPSLAWCHVTEWHWFSIMHQEGNMLPASNLQTGEARNISGRGSMWPNEHVGKNTISNVTELVASNLSVCKPGLKFTTGLIAMLGIVKVWRPRWSSFDRFYGKLQCQGTHSVGKTLPSWESTHIMSK